MSKPLVPPPLKKGDCIGVFAPAGPLEDQTAYNEGINILKELGFQIKVPTPLWPGQDYLADSDSNRALELNRLWADPEVKGLLALRGGYGCLRILEGVDLPLVSRKPKLLIGFSDITVLQTFLTSKTGLITLHGPVLNSLYQLDRPSLTRFYYSLLGQWNKQIHCRSLEILRGGDDTKGILAGGNLSSIATLLGTPYEPDWKNKIVVLEDIGESPYRLDRLFTQITLAGKFDNAAGIILGDFSLSPLQDRLEKMKINETLWNRVLELTRHVQIPIWGGFDIGHTQTNMTLPLGAISIMNSRQGVLEFEC